MGRIFEIQAKNLYKFRRETRRKLRKGDTIRIYGTITEAKVRELLDLRPKTKDILKSKNYTTKINTDGSVIIVSLGIAKVSNRTAQSNQKLWDVIASYADWGHAPFTTSNGDGGAFKETSLTTEVASEPFTAITIDSITQGLKGFGNNMPSVPNLLLDSGLDDAATMDLWYSGEGSYSHVIDNGNFDRYLRIRNGASIRYMTDPGSLSPSIVAPYHEIICARFYPAPGNETTGRWKHQGGNTFNYEQAIPVAASTSNLEYFKTQLWEYKIDGSGNWEILLNGVVDASGAGGSLTAFSEWYFGSNGHPLEHQIFFTIKKFGGFNTWEINTIRDYALTIWPNALPSYPCLDTIYLLASQQWNSITKEWDLTRNKTVVFSGGNGIEGTHDYQWYYWNDADAVTFPIQNKLDEHLPFTGVDGQNSTLNRNHYIAGNGRGNPTIFTNPGVAGNIWVMCVITPKDSLGAEGEKIVSQWTQDNIA